jgi:hypothetical protein
MNLILGTLTELKVHLLNEALRTPTTFDATIAAIGKGVAGRMEKYCTRKFWRTAGDTYETNADRAMISLPRYPVEAVTKLEIRDDLATGWVDQGSVNSIALNLNSAAGLLDLGSYIGASFSRLRVTYTGGFWFPDDGQTESDRPSGAAARPDDLYLAWLLQCERLWSVRDDLGVAVTGDKQVQFVSQTIASFELVPEVKEILNAHRRLTLT